MNDTTNTTSLPPLPAPLKEVRVYADHGPTNREPEDEVFDADQMREYARAAIALSPPALDAPVVAPVMTRWRERGQSSWVCIPTEDFNTEYASALYEVEHLYASPVAAQAVTDAMVERACFAYHKAHDFMGPPPRADRMREALTAALAHPNAAPCDAQGASNA